MKNDIINVEKLADDFVYKSKLLGVARTFNKSPTHKRNISLKGTGFKEIRNQVNSPIGPLKINEFIS